MSILFVLILEPFRVFFFFSLSWPSRKIQPTTSFPSSLSAPPPTAQKPGTTSSAPRNDRGERSGAAKDIFYYFYDAMCLCGAQRRDVTPLIAGAWRAHLRLTCCWEMEPDIGPRGLFSKGIRVLLVASCT